MRNYKSSGRITRTGPLSLISVALGHWHCTVPSVSKCKAYLLTSPRMHFLQRVGFKWRCLATVPAVSRLSIQNLTMSACAAGRPQVYVTRPDVAEIGIQLLKAECDVTTWTQPVTIPREELLKNIPGKDALFCALTDKVDAEVLDKAGPSLKVVATISVGFDHIDVAECKKRGIRIGYTPDVLTDATAELTLALLLATNRRLFEANKEVYNGGWKDWSPGLWMCGYGLKGSVVGIYGFGRIGEEVAKRILPFKPASVLYNSRSEKEEATRIGAKYVTFEELVRNSDFIIPCAALTKDTALKFNKEAFAMMKERAIFINTARGGLVDHEALYAALKEKRIHAAGLDVTTPEPLPLDDPLLKLPNVVVLPHIGSADINTRVEMSRITAVNILNALKGKAMLSEVL